MYPSTWLAALTVICCPLGSTLLGAEPAASRPADEPANTLLPIPAEIAQDVPPARKRTDVAPLLGEPDVDSKPLHIVLVAGSKDHGPGEHDYPGWQKAWKKLLEQSPGTRVTTAWEKPSPEDFRTADVMVLFKHCAWPQELNQPMDAYFARGGGMVLLHWAVDGCGNDASVGKYLGLYWSGTSPKYRHGRVDLLFEDQANQPFLRGLGGKKLRFHDECYWRLAGDAAGMEVLAGGMEDDGNGLIRVPLIWNRQVGKGRVHVNILGHYSWTFNDPVFRILVLRGIAWAGGRPIDRFTPLATVDAMPAD